MPGEDGLLAAHATTARIPAEALSTQALTIRFVGREREMEAALDYLLPDADGDARGKALVVHGDSGTGKTYFARELMLRVNVRQPNALLLYVDVANDEYQASRTIESLLKLALVPGPMRGTSRISVPEPLSLERFRRQRRDRRVGRGFLRALAQAIATAVGIGPALSGVLSGGGSSSVPLAEDELAAYLSWAARREDVYVAVDNIQFVNLDVRLTLESVLQRVGNRTRLIVVDRTVDGTSELDPPVRCFAEDQLEVDLGPLTRAETELVVAGAIGADTEATARLADDIFTKTQGVAKDIEYCLRQYSLELGRGARAGAIEGLLTTIDRLPLVHRQFLVIAALLDGGVKQAIARGTVSRLAAIHDDASLDGIVDELVARDYLRLNGESGDRLRPGHERIVTALRDLADDDLHEEVRRSLIEELSAALDAVSVDESETYLLHCLVGLQTARELARNVHYITRLIQSQHRQDQFSYLVAISNELQEILPLLPEHALNDLLDAMQKSSAFEQGLQLVARLDANAVPGADGRKMYRLKYLTQAYRYDEALELSERIGDHGWGAVYRINALMALERNDEARSLADEHLSTERSEWQAVLRRNTVTLYDIETALRHLDEAEAYFQDTQSDFRLATIDTNRGMVYVNAGRHGDALRVLERAVARMRYVGSREVFEPLVNIAVRSALRGDYDAALRTLEEAALHVPRALLLDQAMIESNRIVIGCASGVVSAEAAEQAFADCRARIRGFEMPDIQELITTNLAAVHGTRSAAAAPATDHVGLVVPLHAAGVTWDLEMEVHWRY